ncbi:ISL3 family transposase [Lactobacillus sp. CC-MHH1034]|uniref:ISL3 family transposase n=1 Tax=Agrilactobacillus fermenti TaxID=2586909 RepID=UPI001E3ADA06|nr:ISL3 family transposase [Agrilactobacillus fermenti]MCD2257260.1 ISL3 family transposase [Agrilactobacillus fermenti]
MFPTTDSTENVLGIKDRNIKFDENLPFETKKIKDERAAVYHAKLESPEIRCINCDFEGSLIKYGKKTRRLKLPNVTATRQPVYLELKKQRYLCKQCRTTFMAKTEVVAAHCSITRPVHWAITLDARTNTSLKTIAQRYHISSASVQRILIQDNAYSLQEKRNYLPEHLCFDEFKATDTYSFIWMDAQSHALGAVLPSRRIATLKDYFLGFPLAERLKVKSIVVDLNAAYINFIPAVFPNVQIIIDRFHIINMANRALNTCRKRLMKQQKRSSREYKLLKSNWRIFLRDAKTLEAKKLSYHPTVGYYDTDVNLVHLALSLDETFKQTYEVYQGTYSAVHDRDAKALKAVLNNYRPLHNEMDTTIRSLKIHWQALLNSCRYDYSNGPIEGANHKIKEIKRTSYGFRNQRNFKLRIYLQFAHI